MQMTNRKLTLASKAKLQRRMEIGQYWYIAVAVRRHKVSPEVADANIVFHKSRAEISDWFLNKLNELQALNKARYDEQHKAI